MSKILPSSIIGMTMVALGACSAEDMMNLKNHSVDESGQSIRANNKLIQDQYIVVMRPTASFRSKVLIAQAKELAAEVDAKITRHYSSLFQGFAANMTESQANALSHDPRVLTIEQNAVFTANVIQQEDAPWGLDRIDQEASSLNTTYHYSYTGDEVNVYVIDTGIYTEHDDFGGRASVEYFNEDYGRIDGVGHGTHVAGTIGGQIYGVAKKVKLIAVKVLDDNGQGSTGSVLDGMEWVYKNAVKPAVVNMSLGGGYSGVINNSVGDLIQAGITVVVAAGNEDDNACDYSPAGAENAITVGSIDYGSWADYRSTFSNFGDCVDIFAPGNDIRSAEAGDRDGTRTESGTSMASPHVAGAAALYLHANPQAKPSEVATALIDNATRGKVDDAKGSPNLILNTSFLINGDGEEDIQDEIHNGGQIDNISASNGEWVYYRIHVPAGATDLMFKISGGSGDADLHVKSQDKPTNNKLGRLCKNHTSDNNEKCTKSKNKLKDRWYYIGLRARKTFRDVSLQASFAEPGEDNDEGDDGTEEIQNGEKVSNISASRGEWVYYRIHVPAWSIDLVFETSGGSGNADLRVKKEVKPTDEKIGFCRDNTGDNKEICTKPYTQLKNRWYYIGLRATKSFSGVSLQASFGDRSEEIQNGRVISNLKAKIDEWLYFKISVPAGATNLVFEINGGSGNADLRVKKEVKPTNEKIGFCRDNTDDNSEVCEKARNKDEDRWYYIGLRAKESFDGVSLKVSFLEPEY